MKSLQFKRILSLLLAVVVIGMFVSVSWALDSQTSGITPVTPPEGAIINSSDTELSFAVTDIESPLVTTGCTVTVNGSEISTELQYQGHYITDSNGNSNYMVDSYNQATVKGHLTGLKDGDVNVEAQVMDQAGNKLSKSWKFNVLILPVVANQTPDGKNNVDTSTPKINVEVAYNGSIFNVAGATLKIDGSTAVKPVVSGAKPNYQLSYSPSTLKDGSHTVALTIPNTVDATKSQTTSWSFNVAVPPVIAKPSPNYTVTSGTPTLAAYATDNSGLTKATFIIDGGEQTLNGQIDPIYGRVSAKVPTTLQDKQHNVSLKVYDSAGNVATTTWDFKVDTQVGLAYPDMPVNNDATCWTCHPKNFAFTAGNVNLAGSHNSPTQCQRCHGEFGTYVKFRNCVDCHYGNFLASSNHTYGLSPTVYQNVPNRQHQIKDIHLSSTSGCNQCHSRILTEEHNRLDKNGNQITCDTCHTGSYLAKQIGTDGKLRVDAATAGWTYGYHYLTWNTPSGTTVNRIYLDMNSSMSLGDVDILCDTPGGGKQWARVNPSTYGFGAGKRNLWLDLPVAAYGVRLRILAYGSDTGYIDIPKAMTTVDKTNPEYVKLQTAIANNDTSCTACHDGAGHEQVHKDELDDKCQTCHKSTLTQEHLNNTTTQGKGYNCDTCHSSKDKNVLQAIKQKVVSCGTCHLDAHKLPLGTKLPGDITLYSGVTWTAPIDGAIFSGETSTPAGYDAGQVVISNRKDINVDEVWSFYKTQMSENQWALQSNEPSSGADYFAAEFAKNGRKVMIRCFHSALGNGTGGDSSGYRIEIWYK